MMRSEGELVLALLMWKDAASKEEHAPTRHLMQGIIQGLEYALGKDSDKILDGMTEVNE